MRYIAIKSCANCPYFDHTGAFTPNGAINVCRHSHSLKTFRKFDHTKRHTKDRPDKNIFVAKLEKDLVPPKWCPLPVLP